MNDDSASGADGDVASARVKDTGPALGAVLPGWVAGRRTVSTVPGGLGRVTSLAWLEIVLASAAFAALCVVTLSVAPQLMEPDDYAYRASITGITQGYFLTLSTAQAHALQAQLGGADPGPGAAEPSGPRGVPLISQWVQLPNGRWISEKNPGYPFLAAPFQLLGIIRLAPLCYGALGCLGLFCGARRWLGRFGGATAVGLFCSSGAALLFAWRDYMPTYTEASLIAAGTGALLWAVLADEAAARRRTRAACRRARRLALRQCLPPGLLTAFQATCGQASTRLTVASERLRVLKELTAGDPAAGTHPATPSTQ
jgi:hypothetical protein